MVFFFFSTVVGAFFEIDLRPKTETFWKSHKRKIVFFYPPMRGAVTPQELYPETRSRGPNVAFLNF